MLEFWLSLAVFLGSHMAISRSRLKPFLISKIGKKCYLIAYSALSVILLGWLIVAAQNAPRIQLWPWEHWLYWIPNILMPFAFILLVAGFIVPNPLSISSRTEGFDPEKPGLIISITRHPVLWGFLLWALSHLIPNGEYPLAMMFAVFVVFSIIGMILLDHKKRKDLGDGKWFEYARLTSAMLCFSQSFLSGKFKITKQDVTGIILGLLIYIVFYSLHGNLFGISPTPPPL